MSTTMEAVRMSALLLRTLTSGQGHAQLTCDWDSTSQRYSVIVVRGKTNERLEASQLNETSLISLLTRAIDYGDCFEHQIPVEPLTLNVATPAMPLFPEVTEQRTEEEGSQAVKDTNPPDSLSPGPTT